MKTAIAAVAGIGLPKNQENQCLDAGISKNEAYNHACASIDMVYLADRKAFVPLATCVVEHVIFNSELPEIARLFYLLADSYAHIASKTNSDGLRETEKSGEEWGNLLSSHSAYIYQVQKKLEAQGYFSVIRKKINAQNEINRIIPTLPAPIFDILKVAPNQYAKQDGISTAYNHANAPQDPSQRRSLLDDTKLFAKFNLSMYKALLQDMNLTPLQKLLWVYCFMRSHCSATESIGEGSRKFLMTYKEIAARFNCAESTLSKAFTNLKLFGYINIAQIHLRNSDSASRRRAKSVWEVEALFPIIQMEKLKALTDRSNLQPLTLAERVMYAANINPVVNVTNNVAVNNYVMPNVAHSTSTNISTTDSPNIAALAVHNFDITSRRSYGSSERSCGSSQIDHLSNKDLTLENFNNKNFKAIANANVFLPDKSNEEIAPEIVSKLSADYAKLIAIGIDPSSAKQQLSNDEPNENKVKLTLKAFELYQNYMVEQQNLSGTHGQSPIKLHKEILSRYSLFEQALLDEVLIPNYRVLTNSDILDVLLQAKQEGEQIMQPNVSEIPIVAAQTNNLFVAKDMPAFNSLEPEALVDTGRLKKIKYWVNLLAEKNQITGEAKAYTQYELISQVAFHVKHWQPKVKCWDKAEFATYIACKKLKAGTWKSPYGIPRAREEFWQQEKRRMYQ